jgi:hypothetical protein
MTREIAFDDSWVYRDGYNPFSAVSPSEFVREQDVSLSRIANSMRIDQGSISFTNLLWLYNMFVPIFFRTLSESFPGETEDHRIPSGAALL